MKKLYVTPEIEIIDTELTEMLCLSSPLDGDAGDPAHARGVFSDDDDWDSEE